MVVKNLHPSGIPKAMKIKICANMMKLKNAKIKSSNIKFNSAIQINISD
jgi:hypothetical protein